MSIEIYHAVHFMNDVHTTKKQHLQCVPQDQKHIQTQKKLLLLETSIAELHENFYIPEIQKVVFNSPRVCILHTHQCGKEYHEALKHPESS